MLNRQLEAALKEQVKSADDLQGDPESRPQVEACGLRARIKAAAPRLDCIEDGKDEDRD